MCMCMYIHHESRTGRGSKMWINNNNTCMRMYMHHESRTVTVPGPTHTHTHSQCTVEGLCLGTHTYKLQNTCKNAPHQSRRRKESVQCRRAVSLHQHLQTGKTAPPQQPRGPRVCALPQGCVSAPTSTHCATTENFITPQDRGPRRYGCLEPAPSPASECSAICSSRLWPL